MADNLIRHKQRALLEPGNAAVDRGAVLHGIAWGIRAVRRKHNADVSAVVFIDRAVFHEALGRRVTQYRSRAEGPSDGLQRRTTYS